MFALTVNKVVCGCRDASTCPVGRKDCINQYAQMLRCETYREDVLKLLCVLRVQQAQQCWQHDCLKRRIHLHARTHAQTHTTCTYSRSVPPPIYIYATMLICIRARRIDREDKHQTGKPSFSFFLIPLILTHLLSKVTCKCRQAVAQRSDGLALGHAEVLDEEVQDLVLVVQHCGSGEFTGSLRAQVCEKRVWPTMCSFDITRWPR